MDMLVRTPRPYETESLLGYVLRVSEENGYDTPTRMLKATGAAGVSGTSFDISLKVLSALVGGEIANLSKLAYRETGSQNLYLLGRPVCAKFGRSMLRLSSPAFCPHCVKDSGYIDGIWDLALIAACPKHKCAVINRCHCCEKGLSYHRPGILTCNCGADLAGAPALPVSEQIAALMEIILAKIHGRSVLTGPHRAEFPLEHLEPLSLLDFCELLSQLARHALHLHRNANNDDHLLAAKMVSDVLCDWPMGFHQLLHRIASKFPTSADRPSSLRPLLKHFYSPMFGNQDRGTKFKFLHDEFIRFVRTQIAASENTKNFYQSGAASSSWAPKVLILRAFGLNERAFKIFTDHFDIQMRIDFSTGRMIRYFDFSLFES